MLGNAAFKGVPFPDPDVARVSIVIWTTTPWTLPANQAVCIHPEFEYAFVKVGEEVFIMAAILGREGGEGVCHARLIRLLGTRKGQRGIRGSGDTAAY